VGKVNPPNSQNQMAPDEILDVHVNWNHLCYDWFIFLLQVRYPHIISMI